MNYNGEQSINYGSKIWDLHIHTCSCPKGSSEFSKMDVTEYIDQIIAVFNLYPNLELISFTDHNKISIEVYEEYIRQGAPKAFIVGVEIDTVLIENNKESCTKHLIVYFDIDKTNFFERKDYIEDLNAFLLKNIPVKIDELLNYLVSKHHKFLLSPHAFKQDKRGFEYSWNDEITANEQTPKYLDQFFAFWETSGTSAIARAEEFLSNKLGENSVQIVHFSDSNNFTKLRTYLDNPTQYFRALPVYKGVELVGTDVSRITRDCELPDSLNNGNMIKSITINGQEIQLSDKLNAIIGGRGSGKSLLLDALAKKLNHKKTIELEKKRLEFISGFDVQPKNFSDHFVKENSLMFDYYSQSYVSDMFRSKNYNAIILDRFSEELGQIDDFNAEELKSENKNKFKEIYKNNIDGFDSGDKNTLENISSLAEKYKSLTEHRYSVNTSKIKKDKAASIDYHKFVGDFDKYIDKLIPVQLKNDPRVISLRNQFKLSLLEEIHIFNTDWNNSTYLKNMFLDSYKEYKNNLSKRSKDKAEIEREFTNQFSIQMYPYVKRVALIKAYLQIDNLIDEMQENGFEKACEDGSFKFTKVLQIEKPIDHLKTLFEKYFSAEQRRNLETAINYYCFTENHKLLANKDINSLDQEITDFELQYETHAEIYYKDKDSQKYKNIKELSPGTQTNVLMEYIVHKDTTKPLLIDQPEDNIDNYTIYTKLSSWFRKMKRQRQVLVVTHDANIVINSDAENIIIAEHNSENEFTYKYGALEFEDNLDVAANILDGGKDAVKRRLMKYGE